MKYYRFPKKINEAFDFDELDGSEDSIEKEVASANKAILNLQNKEKMKEFCELYGIENYTIDSQGISVDGDVSLMFRNLKFIPWKFSVVNGNFDVSFNNLVSLKNSPDLVRGDFDCGFNYIKSFEGCPKVITGKFIGQRQKYGLNKRLNDFFYRDYITGKVDESFKGKGKLVKTGHFGDVIAISEDFQYCDMILENGYVINNIPTNEVEMLDY